MNISKDKTNTFIYKTRNAKQRKIFLEGHAKVFRFKKSFKKSEIDFI